LTKLEEKIIVQRILELDSQAFPPRLSAVEDMANRLLRDRDASRVGKNWASNFVKRQPQLKTVFSRKYDYSRPYAKIQSLLKAGLTLCAIRSQNIYIDTPWAFTLGTSTG
jgi:hypothetical protein